MPSPPPFDESTSLKNIGMPLRLNKYADPNNYTTYKFVRFKNVVDIIPMNFSFDLPTFEEEEADSFLYSHSFSKAIAEYKKVCGYYSLDTRFQGVRCWLTEETSHQDEITHTWTGNMIGDMVNNLSTKGKQLGSIARGVAGMTKSAGGVDGVSGSVESASGADPSSFVSSALGSLSDIIPDDPGSVASGAASAAKTLFNIGVMGYHAQLPKIWKSSNYSPTLTMNMKLISPYGSPRAIKKYVTDPLLYLIILSSPRTHDGITLGKIPYVYVNAYGLANLNIGIINSVSVRRGGDNSLYNQYRQPISIEVSVSVSPAVEGFGVVSSETLRDIAVAPDVLGNTTIKSPGNGPGFTTLGNLIKSFQKAPGEIQYVLDALIKEEPPLFLEQIPDDQLANVKENVSDRLDNVFGEIQPLDIFGDLNDDTPPNVLVLDLDGLSDDIGSDVGNLDDFLNNFDMNNFPLSNDNNLSPSILSGDSLEDALDKNIYTVDFNDNSNLDDVFGEDITFPQELDDLSLKDYQSPNLDQLNPKSFEDQIRENLNNFDINPDKDKVESILSKSIPGCN